MRGTDIAKRLIDKFTKERPVLIYGDPDVDGLLSLYLVCRFLDIQKVKYSFFLNDKRKHGFELQPSALSGYFVIAVDFDIPSEIMKSLVENDVCIVSIDHHEIQGDFLQFKNDKTGAEGVIINNQYFFEDKDNHYLSGAGVVYEVLREEYPFFNSTEFEALVGITLLSDARPIENDRARSYLKVTYSSNTQSGYLNYLIDEVSKVDFGFGVPRLDRNFIDFTLSPRINSLLRFGKEKEALNFILGKGLITRDSKERQTDVVSVMLARCKELNLPHMTVLYVDVNDFLDYLDLDLTSFIGLVCSKKKGTGLSVLGFVIDNGVVTRASFRGRYDDVPYRMGFVNNGIDAQGHNSAFGIRDLEPTQNLWIELDTLIGQLDERHTSKVTVLEVSNLSFVMLNQGLKIATENCYVRDMYRTYFKYVGTNANKVKETFKTVDGVDVPKYIEYLVDGKKVKSFGIAINDGYILPVLEKGYINLYMTETIV